jgi:murein DD-endopeptidase MepM/ murein hydrolase activator NlpD
MPAPALAALLSLALAAPTVSLAPAAARPGDVVLVEVAGAAAAPQGTLAGRSLAFWADPGTPGTWRALAALPLEAPLGAAPCRVTADGAPLGAELQVVEPGFTAHQLTLAPKYVEPPPSVRQRMEADRRAFARAFAQPFAPPLFHEDFDWPRRAPTTGRFGDQRLLNGRKQSVHYGLDLTGPTGSPVAAANDGVVAATRGAYLSGNTVVLWHGGGVYTVYFHLDRIRVREGQRVRRGELIGDLGATGRATGPHLHWGVKVDGLYVDPESLLAIDFARGTAPPRAPRPATGTAPVAEPAPQGPVQPEPVTGQHE